MSNKATNTPKLPEFVPVINHSQRIVNLMAPKKRAPLTESEQADKIVRVVNHERKNLVPGLNYVPSEYAARSSLRTAMDLYRGEIVVEDPCTLDPFRAAQLASVTNTRTALKRWLASEQRPDVRKAIETRMGAIKGDA